MELYDKAVLFTELVKSEFPHTLVSAVLYGSVARGDAHEHSDIDILMVMDGLAKSRYARGSMLDPIFEKLKERRVAGPLNVLLKTPHEAQTLRLLYLDFPTDAKLLFDRDHFFQNIIKRIEERIQKTGAIKKKRGKLYYWDLKPGAYADSTFEVL